MRRVRGNSRGLSEIVGTLILILIVVAAATALSVFVTGYEKQVLSQEAVTHQKNLESYKIYGVSVPDATPNPPIPEGYLTFIIASSTVEASSVTSLLIDDQPVLWYCALPAGANPSEGSNCTGSSPGLGGMWISLGESLRFSALQEYKIVVNYNDTAGFDDNGYNTNAFNKTVNAEATPWDFPLNLTRTLTISIYTAFSNNFIQVMLAPIAIAAVTTLNVPGTSTVVTALDAESSTQPGNQNDSIVSWYWNVTNITGGAMTPTVTLSGEEVPVNNSDWAPTANDTYRIQLTVIDGTGLFDSETIDWTDP